MNANMQEKALDILSVRAEPDTTLRVSRTRILFQTYGTKPVMRKCEELRHRGYLDGLYGVTEKGRAALVAHGRA
jgi:hypothetical protein